MSITAYDRLKTSRLSSRPTARKYIEKLFKNTLDLHGDRCFGDDPAIVGGIGDFNGIPVTYIAIEKGSDLNTRLKTNFGSPKPEGYRKALRLMRQAEKFRRPIICFVDTPGAFCGADGEERGEGQAIAESIMEMFGLKTPTISIVIGQGGSGGALALCASDRVYMLENSVYSVISPEGCASILWKDSSRAHYAADCLRITAEDMKKFEVAERVIPEDFDNFDAMCVQLSSALETDIKDMLSKPTEVLLDNRYNRFRKFGVFNENGNTVSNFSL